MTDFAKYLEKFFHKYLISDYGASKHTIRAYRDSFSLLLSFMNKVKSIDADKIELKHINKDIILDFLSWLEYEHNNNLATRNQRCAAIRSFFKFLMYEEPTRIGEWQNIRSIRLKKTIIKTVSYLSLDGIKLLLEQIPNNNRCSMRDLAMLALLYDSGARVQELIDLSPSNIRFEEPYKILLRGKGNKERLVPLQIEQIRFLKQYIIDYGLGKREKENTPLFFNRVGERLTSAGVTYILKKYANAARFVNPEIIPQVISPHTLRHSKAMHLAEAGLSLFWIRDFLGHSSIQTTDRYTRTNSKQMRKALEAVYEDVLPQVNNEGSWGKNSALKEFLKGLS
ncbi:tyrosine-type recombinase/integrase [Chryseobacterium polytrichastri]|uniref:Site-specific recombinase XerD n=1 Tax=Chryseobacterium polytrichastri TaxID=1302687 RepID=A0A1M7BU67_9FLAO|nr:tyrosine-type recombinase/integrase [Chryseobacterium polytrichastri]SHL58542.1 Site-specific recombinase XerD [Chryseobacterium polytrichastri]